MIDNWEQAGAVVGSVLGSVGIVSGAVYKAFISSASQNEKTLDALLSNQTDQTRILDRLSLLIEHRDTRTEELHRDTHKKIEEATVTHNRKLDEVTHNQREIITTIQNLRLI